MTLFPFAPRSSDRKATRPPDLLFAAHESMPWPMATAMALQHLALQAIYSVLPVAVADALGLDTRSAANFLCLSLLPMAILTLAHAMWRGPVGAGYQMASISAPVFVGAYLVCAANGVAIDQIAALVVISGVVAVGLVLLMPRPEKIFPSELAGVSVFLLGASLLPLVFDLLSNKGQLAPAAIMLEMAIIVPAFMAMMVMALSRLPIAPFAVIIGATLGLMLAAWLMPEQLQFATALASNPWLAVPQPILPRFEGLTLGLVIIFVIPILPTFISLLGSLAALQRAADADWKKPDSPPLRRGLLASSLSIFAAGLLGGMVPSPSSACYSLSIANRALSRQIAFLGAAILCAMAFSPQIAALGGLLPKSVQAVMLIYVAVIMLVSGIQLITARMLDTRRTLVAGVGIFAGMSVLILPGVFRTYLPALASPLSFGCLAALLVHLLTLPLVTRQASLSLPVGASLPRLAEDETIRLGGAWGTRHETMQKVEHFLIEIGEVMALRGENTIRVAIRYLEGEVSVVLKHEGGMLPKPSAQPAALSLESDMDDQLGFILWLAIRQASTVERKSGELRLTFLDV
jgi:NCS2 family nucleobase:cation symporter-2